MKAIALRRPHCAQVSVVRRSPATDEVCLRPDVPFPFAGEPFEWPFVLAAGTAGALNTTDGDTARTGSASLASAGASFSSSTGDFLSLVSSGLGMLLKMEDTREETETLASGS